MSRALAYLGRACALSCALLSGGCYSVTIVNGKAPAPAPVLEDKWRSSAVLDIVAIDTPINMEAVCKETGWAKIRQVLTPLDWFADLFLAGGWLYESTHVDLYCAKGSGAPPTAVPVQQPPTGTPNFPPPTGTPNFPPPNPPSQPPQPGSPLDKSL